MKRIVAGVAVLLLFAVSGCAGKKAPSSAVCTAEALNCGKTVTCSGNNCSAVDGDESASCTEVTVVKSVSEDGKSEITETITKTKTVACE